MNTKLALLYLKTQKEILLQGEQLVSNRKLRLDLSERREDIKVTSAQERNDNVELASTLKLPIKALLVILYLARPTPKLPMYLYLKVLSHQLACSINEAATVQNFAMKTLHDELPISDVESAEQTEKPTVDDRNVTQSNISNDTISFFKSKDKRREDVGNFSDEKINEKPSQKENSSYRRYFNMK